jgi:hypothetical protein
MCGVKVPWNNTHTCIPTSVGTVTAPLTTYSVGPRKYRITGKISSPGQTYAVDLVVEALP